MAMCVVLCTAIFWMIGLAYVIEVGAGSIETFVTSIKNPVNDDGEEFRTNTRHSKKGEVVLTSTDLELCREIQDGDGDDAMYLYVGLRFSGVYVPRGSTILRAHVEFSVDIVDNAVRSEVKGADKPVSLRIVGEYTGDAAPFLERDFDISRRIEPGTPQSVAWVETEPWKYYLKRNSSNIRPVIQSIVDRNDWEYGNALSLVIFGSTSDKGTRIANSRVAGTAAAPKLIVIYYFDGPAPPPLSQGSVESVGDTARVPLNSFVKSIDNRNDDGEEVRTNTRDFKRGEVILDGGDLDLCRELRSNKDVLYFYVGLRFSDLDIPQGVGIVSAHIEFTVAPGDLLDFDDKAGATKDVSLTIVGEYADDALPFLERDFDISRRIDPGTPRSVAWVETEKWRFSEKRNTSDISPVIQDIVGRNDWKLGNALAIVLFGTTEDTGTREALSRDSVTGLKTAPKLILEYVLPRDIPLACLDYPHFPSCEDITQNPTPAPTRQPTSFPTTSPTFSPSRTPTLNPTRSPTTNPTLAPTGAPTLLPTPSPTENPTLSPTANHTVPPTPARTGSPTLALPTEPTQSPTLVPMVEQTTTPPTLSSPLETPMPIKKKDIVFSGKVSFGAGRGCSRDGDCASGACRSGVCMTSSDCYPLKHKYGSPFHTNHINIVFVASAFNNETLDKWQTQVNLTYSIFGNYNMFSKDIEKLSVFRVDPTKLDSAFCGGGCAGVDRLLCCDIERAHQLSSRCSPIGSNLQTVVIHNSNHYGGAGYVSSNVATVSVHPSSPLVAVHELGHSLFKLNDEYKYGTGVDSDPNCDFSRKCGKWKDLVGRRNTPDGYETVRCERGCQNNNYYVGARSFMSVLNLPVGAVNERFTCCTYQVLTKSFPSYCDVFDSPPGYLFNYCKEKDYQKYGPANYEIEPLLAIPANAQEAKNNENSMYVYVSDPVLVTIKPVLRRNGKTVFKVKQTHLPPGPFLRPLVEGDFSKPKAAAKKGLDSVVKVRVLYQGAKKATLFLSRNVTIDVPLREPNDTTQHDEALSVSQASDVIEAVLDTKGRPVKSVRAFMIAI